MREENQDVYIECPTCEGEGEISFELQALSSAIIRGINVLTATIQRAVELLAEKDLEKIARELDKDK